MEKVRQKKKDVIVITELPIGMWTDKYKEFLEDLLESKKLKYMKNYSTPEKVHFEIVPSPEVSLTMDKLKLKSTLSTTNLILFDENESIHKYTNVADILRQFCTTRLGIYTKRKEHVYKTLHQEYILVKSKIMFLEEVIKNKLVLYNRDEKDIVHELEERDFAKKDDGYDYLLSLPVRSFSKQKIALLVQKKDQLKEKIRYIKKTTEQELWRSELDTLEDALKK